MNTQTHDEFLDTVGEGSFPASDPPPWPVTHSGPPSRRKADEGATTERQRRGAIPTGGGANDRGRHS